MRRCFAKLRHVTISIHVTSSFRFRSSGSNFEVKCFCQLLVWKCLKSVMWLGSILFLNKLTMLTVAHADWVYRLFVLWYMWILANEVFSLTTNVPTWCLTKSYFDLIDVYNCCFKNKSKVEFQLSIPLLFLLLTVWPMRAFLFCQLNIELDFEQVLPHILCNKRDACLSQSMEHRVKDKHWSSSQAGIQVDKCQEEERSF